MIGSYALDMAAPKIGPIAHPAYNTAGVYALWLGETCVYVGYSGCPRERITTHRQKLRKGNHENSKLQELFNLHGISGMSATLLPILPHVVRQELAWLTKLRPAGNTDTCSEDFNPQYRHIRALTHTVRPAPARAEGEK